jgi:hypothetical protein
VDIGSTVFDEVGLHDDAGTAACRFRNLPSGPVDGGYYPISALRKVYFG